MEVADILRKSYGDLEFGVFRTKLAGYARSAHGKALCTNGAVLFEKDAIARELDRTEEVYNFISQRKDFEGLGFERIGDIMPVMAKSRIGDIIVREELKLLKDFLDACMSVDDFRRKVKPDKEPRICDSLYPWESLAALVTRYKQVFTPEGEVRDGATPALKKLRSDLEAQESLLRKRVGTLVAQFQKTYGDEVHLSLRHNRFVVALPRSAQSVVSGMVVDLSGGGAQVMVEPEPIIDLNNARVRLFVEEEIEVRRILLDFAREVSGYARQIEVNLEIMAELDFIFARAQYSLRENCTRPGISGASFELTGARHPLIAGFIPEDIRLEPPFTGMVISGVNAGGKTVLLKLVGLLTLMSSIGCFIPAERGSSVPEVGAVFADIGDDQSISAQLSTFTSHLHFLKGLDAWLYGADPETNLPYCRKPALILMDEIGGGTEPTEGAALAFGVMAYLLKQPAIPILTTHYDLLKGMAYKYPNVKNVALEFDEVRLRPTFKVIENQPGKSFALDIAGTFGINSQITGIAKTVLGSKDSIMADVIKELDEARTIAQRKARESEELAEANRKLREELREIKEEFVRESKRFRNEMERKLSDMVDAAKESIKSGAKQSKPASDIVMIASVRKTAKAVEERIEQELEKAYEELNIEEFIVEKTERAFEPGDIVVMTGAKTPGRILEIDAAKKRASIDMNGLRVTVKLSEIKLVNRREYELARKLKDAAKGEGADSRISAAAAEVTKETLDLHGKTVEEAHEALELFMDAAIRSGLAEVKVMHGIGTGALKRFVADYLKRYAQVSHVRSASPADGGVGVTIAVLGKKGEALGR